MNYLFILVFFTFSLLEVKSQTDFKLGFADSIKSNHITRAAIPAKKLALLQRILIRFYMFLMEKIVFAPLQQYLNA